MAKESALTQHCLGEFDNIYTGEGGYGEHYIELIREKKIELYSLRNTKNQPHVTIALYRDNNIIWLDQIKGKQNRFPIVYYTLLLIVKLFDLAKAMTSNLFNKNQCTLNNIS